MQYKIDKKVLDEFVLLAEEVRHAAGVVTETGADSERHTIDENLKQMIRLMVDIKHSFNLNLIIIA